MLPLLRGRHLRLELRVLFLVCLLYLQMAAGFAFPVQREWQAGCSGVVVVYLVKVALNLEAKHRLRAQHLVIVQVDLNSCFHQCFFQRYFSVWQGIWSYPSLARIREYDSYQRWHQDSCGIHPYLPWRVARVDFHSSECSVWLHDRNHTGWFSHITVL